ncbi:MAG TPA: hypothetical protein VMQ45_03215 [Burkholderiaceae bacterium]|jgi:hypothetical protein|nr:hypothetical protein [Burkholderiaceae bacterium]
MSMRVSIAVVAFACAAAAAPAAFAYDYPTTDRVQYVLECMYRNGGSSVYVYKCSCAIDAIAQKYTYDDWVNASTIARYQNMPGEGMGVFRDSPEGRDAAKRYREVEADAKKSCDVPK